MLGIRLLKFSGSAAQRFYYPKQTADAKRNQPQLDDLECCSRNKRPTTRSRAKQAGYRRCQHDSLEQDSRLANRTRIQRRYFQATAIRLPLKFNILLVCGISKIASASSWWPTIAIVGEHSCEFHLIRKYKVIPLFSVPKLSIGLHGLNHNRRRQSIMTIGRRWINR